MFEPLGARTTPAAVYDQVRRAILDGHLPPGSQLREAHLAEEFGISRSPLREALGRLEEDGLVEKFPFRGAFVAQVSARTIDEIASLRVQLEPFAVHLSLDRLLGDLAGEMEARLARLVAAATAGNEPDSIDAHLQFHRLFYEAANHELLLSGWNSWESKLRLFFVDDHQAFDHPYDIARVHTELANTIRTGSRETIGEVVRHHIHSAPGTEALDDPTPGHVNGRLGAR